MIIYKITNLINNKVYIGLTTTSLNKRWNAHIRDAKKDPRHLYCSMRKYGIDNFKIEQLDTATSFQELGILERKYVKIYDSQNPEKGYNLSAGGEANQLDANPRATLTIEDVVRIREIYSECEIGCKQCWEIYKDRISYSAFKKIWTGNTWKNIKPEVYTPKLKKIHVTGRRPISKYAKFSPEIILTMRKYYVNHSITEIIDKFQITQVSKKSLASLLVESYDQVPIYKKKLKKWFYLGKEIKIENYKPVTTILRSEK